MDLGNGYSVTFSHLSDVPDQFKNNDGTIDHSRQFVVSAGDILGFVGQTGNSLTSGREPHAHIVTRVGGVDFDPRYFYSDPDFYGDVCP